MTSPTLSTLGAKRFAHLEEVIDGGFKTFVEVGNALLEIRDGRLYREQFDTFELYCRNRWHMSKTNANRLIGSAEIAASLAPIGVTVANSAQARALAPLKDDPEAMKAVMEAASENGAPTAEVIKAEVVKMREPEPEPTPEEVGLAAFTQSVIDKHPEWAITDAYFKATKHADALLSLKPGELVAAMGSDDINRDSLKSLATQFAEWADSVLTLLEPGLRRVK